MCAPWVLYPHRKRQLGSQLAAISREIAMFHVPSAVGHWRMLGATGRPSVAAAAEPAAAIGGVPGRGGDAGDVGGHPVEAAVQVGDQLVELLETGEDVEQRWGGRGINGVDASA